IAIVAGPILSSVQIATAAARMSILNFQKIEVLFPVRTLFLQRRRTVTNLNPLNAPILELPRFRHVSEVFVSRDRSSTKRFLLDRALEHFFSAGLHFGGNEISHRQIVLLGSPHARVLVDAESC